MMHRTAEAGTKAGEWLNISDIAEVLGRSVSAMRSRMAAGQFDEIPGVTRTAGGHRRFAPSCLPLLADRLAELLEAEQQQPRKKAPQVTPPTVEEIRRRRDAIKAGWSPQESAARWVGEPAGNW